MKIGQKVRATDSLIRFCDGYDKNRNPQKVWKRCAESFLKKLKPIEGHYIGKRTYCNGSYYWEDEIMCMHNKEALKVALVVVNERTNPIPVLMKDLEIVEDESDS